MQGVVGMLDVMYATVQEAVATSNDPDLRKVFNKGNHRAALMLPFGQAQSHTPCRNYTVIPALVHPLVLWSILWTRWYRTWFLVISQLRLKLQTNDWKGVQDGSTVFVPYRIAYLLPLIKSISYSSVV